MKNLILILALVLCGCVSFPAYECKREYPAAYIECCLRYDSGCGKVEEKDMLTVCRPRGK